MPRTWERRTAEPPFVGRVDELAALDGAMDDAISGRPRIVTIVGGPTVGKSRLVGQSLVRALSLGARTFVGAAHEDIQIPFLPIATALRPLWEGSRGWLDETLLTAGREETEGHRLRLFLEITGAIIDEAARRPLLLVVEDVQWADAATADLLIHLAGAVTHEAMAKGLPILLAATSRPTPEGSGARLLTRLRRGPLAVHIDVGPFSQAETHAFVSAVTGVHPRADLLADLHEAASGNPLLLAAALDRMAATGRPDEITGWSKLPDEIRRAIGSGAEDRTGLWLAEISAEARELLTVAALLGDGRDLATLRLILGASMDAPLREATDAGVIAPTDDGRYRFAHSEIRRALEHKLDEDETRRLSMRIADALESSPAADAHAFDIAAHLSRAGDAARPERVATWAVIAGDRASASWAWPEAMQAYAIALAHLDDTSSPSEKLGLLLKTGTAAYHAHDPSGTELLRRAADLARDAGDVRRWAEAIFVLARSALTEPATITNVSTYLDELDAIVEAIGDGDPALRAHALGTMADLCWVSQDLDRGKPLALAAEEALMSEPPSAARANLNVNLGLHLLSELDLAGARARFERAAGDAIAAGEVAIASGARTRAAATLLAEGQLARARPFLETSRRENGRHGLWTEYEVSSAWLSAIAIAEGDFGAAERLIGDALTFYRTDSWVFIPQFVFPGLAVTRALRGDEEGARRAVETWGETGARGTWRYQALVQAWSGDRRGVRGAMNQRPWPAPPSGEIFNLDAACVQVEVAAAIGVREVADSAAPLLLAADARGVRFTLSGAWFIPRLLAEHALLSEDDPASIVQRFDAALRVATTSGARLEQARCRLGLARAMVRYGQHRQAVEHAHRAATELDAIGALTLEREAQSFLGEIESGTPPVSAPALRTILVTDLVDSTGLNVRVGDEHYLALLNEHDGIIRRRLREFDGTEFGHTGDGIAAWFSSTDDAVACALRIRDDLERATIGHPDQPLVARLGITSGEPLAVGRELFGLAVVAACRICDLGAPGQVLVSDEIVQLSTGKGLGFVRLGDFELKGMPQPVTLYEATAA